MAKFSIMLMILVSCYRMEAIFVLTLPELEADAQSYPNPWTEIPCDFERDWCKWSNMTGDYHWLRGTKNDSHMRRARGRRTGTKSAKSGDYYIYIAADRGKNRTAYLQTRLFYQDEPACLSFYFHMKGKHIGFLKVSEYITSNPNDDWSVTDGELKQFHLLWAVHGQQGSDWQIGRVQVPALTSSQRRKLIIEGYDTADGRLGNIVLDAINYTKEKIGCELYPPWASPPTPLFTITTTISTPSSTSAMTMQATETSSISLQENSSRRIDFEITSKAIDLTLKHVSPGASGDRRKTNPLSAFIKKTQASVRKNNFTANSTRSYSKAYDSTFSKIDDLSSRILIPETTVRLVTMSAKYIEASKLPELRTTMISSEDEEKSYLVPSLIWGISGSLVSVVLVSYILFIIYRCRGKRRFGQYDRYTVHMTRTTVDISSHEEKEMQYYKLT